MKNINVHFDFTFPLVVTLVFVILKELDVINWAWYWIISPLWIAFIIVFLVFIIFKLKGWL